MKVLLLGGTTEASALARLLDGDRRFAATLSLAGRTRHPAPQPLPTRIGGFGGVDGLVAYLRVAGIAAIVDATHPFAAQMSRHAAAAAGLAGCPLLVVCRPPWRPEDGDRWQRVPDVATAAACLGPAPRRVFLTIGQKDLAPFAASPWHHYLIRSVDPPPPAALPVGAAVITARAPFREEDELALLAGRAIEVLVTKNSGGEATRSKLRAARLLAIPVVMIDRPPLPEGVETVATAGEAMAWLLARHGVRHPPALRGA